MNSVRKKEYQQTKNPAALSKTEVYQKMHEELISGCRRGDSKSQMQLYSLYHKAMYNTAFRIVHDSMEAEDLMQEAFFDAFDRIDTFKGESTFGAWLKRIVVNKSINQLRARKLELEVLDEEKHERPEEDFSLEPSMNIEMVQEGIESLPEGYRIILSLYLLEGYDHEEIAGILGIKSSTSRSQYTRARAKLKTVLKEKCYA